MAKQPAKGRKTAPKTRKAAVAPENAVESASENTPVIDAIPAEVHPKPAVAAPQEAPTEPPSKPEPTPVQPKEPPKPTPPPPPAQKSGVLPLVFGGLIAGVIGFAVANFAAPQTDEGLTLRVAQQSASLAALEDRVANLVPADLSGIEAAITDLSVRITALEERPANVVSAPMGDVSEITDEMDALRAQLAEMTGAAQAELAEARAAAAAIEQSASTAARAAAGRAALARIQTGLESGAPLGAALNDLESAAGAPAPDALLAAEDGVPTLATLQETFPEAARAALATARSEGVSGENTTGFGAFLRNQFDVRSTAPQDGDSADAILSRAQDALRRGRLSDALAEISALPDVARAEMAGWLAQAELRADAVAAVDILSITFSDN